MARVVKPGGTVIITVANLDCLGFRLGRTFFVRFRKMLRREESIYEKIWQTPFDHTFRFDYKTLNKMVKQHMKVDESIGISLFFASPWWGSILSKLPRPHFQRDVENPGRGRPPHSVTQRRGGAQVQLEDRR